jgi:hypothetical protein
MPAELFCLKPWRREVKQGARFQPLKAARRYRKIKCRESVRLRSLKGRAQIIARSVNGHEEHHVFLSGGDGVGGDIGCACRHPLQESFDALGAPRMLSFQARNPLADCPKLLRKTL